MNTFQSYDLYRLSEYKNRYQQIEFGETKSFTYYRFDKVDYFNYILFNTCSFKKNVLIKVLSKYLHDGKETVRLIYPVQIKEKLVELIDINATYREIVCVKKYIEQDEKLVLPVDILSPVNTWEELVLFTELYLKGFGSRNKDIEDVALNFRFLMDSDQVDFFFVTETNQIAGVCVNFYGERSLFLAGCTIIDPCRNNGLQKKTIDARIYIGRQKGYSLFTSWAYRNSISHENLLKSNLNNYSIYGECLSKPMESLIAASKILQE